MNTHEKYMHRCLELAKLGAGHTAPNPMVGAVLVYNEEIIGEGYHQHFGMAHAEVNCINSVCQENRKYISDSTLYVSLEPCSHFGKTPPCTDLIIQHKIPKVFIGCNDPFSEVNGKGIEKLKREGVEVQTGILEKESKEINKRFFTYHEQKRPYIILKWAETADGKIAGNDKHRLLISNENTNRLVHRWRSEESSILIGTNTAIKDNPELTNRLWSGPSPVRSVVDLDLKLPGTLKLFDGNERTVIFNKYKNEEKGNLIFCKVDSGSGLVKQILDSFFHLKIQSVLVEGGGRLLQSFIDEEMWDEIRVIKNEKLIIQNGLNAPASLQIPCTEKIKIKDDCIRTYLKKKN